MAIMDNTVKIDGYPGVYFKDTDNRFPNSNSINAKQIKGNCFSLVIVVRAGKRFIRSIMNFNDGRPVTACKTAASERERLRNEDYHKATIKTLNELWKEYQSSRKNAVSEQHIKTQDSLYNVHIKAKIGHRHPDDNKEKDIQQIINDMLDMGLSARTAEHIKQLLRPLYKYGVRNHGLKSNPAENVVVPKYDNERDIDVSIDEASRIFKCVMEYENELYRAVLMFCLHGRRLNEVLTLEEGMIYDDKYEVVYEHNKVRKRMRYPLTEVLSKVLEGVVRHEDGLIFRSPKTGEKLSKSGVRKNWMKVLERAGCSGLTLHDARHILGGIMINSGGTLQEIGSVLGHMDPNTTKRYSKVREQTARRVTEEYIKKLSEP